MTSTNPFVELYMTENIATEEFTRLFSPVLLEISDTHSLFQAGNVVLTGLQGSGKTALLNLMRPEVMISFRKRQGKLPLPSECSRFISAGINLNTSKARDFGQRSPSRGDENRSHIAMLFGDFLNYVIIENLLANLGIIAEDRETNLSGVLGVQTELSKLDRFAAKVAADDCWFGALKGITSFRELTRKIRARIQEYRSFLNFNSDLPQTITMSKTSAGEPIAVTADCLRDSEIIPDDVPVLVRIDQFEDLMGVESRIGEESGTDFRGIIMKIISERDRRISYRLGARPYSLYPPFNIYRSRTSAEEMRNYKIVNMDTLLRGKEARSGQFPKFCEDVFRKRIAELSDYGPSVLKRVFGTKDLPGEKAKRYVRTNRANIIGMSHELPRAHTDWLKALAERDPLSARLGEAWLLQQSIRRELTSEDLSERPWTEVSKQWWRKERIQQALMQIAASQKQRMMWYGREEILNLSGHNILMFLTICQFIWAEFLRSGVHEEEDLPVSIDPAVQDIGIQEASAYWVRNVRADPNGGDDRHRFVNVVATDLRAGLRGDRRMSYPGANGFSLPALSLEECPEAGRFLDDCVNYGVLEWFRHTPKTKSRGQSWKWYLFPILTPYFQVPTPHTKEPRYIQVGEVYKWLERAKMRIRMAPPESTGKGGRGATNPEGQAQLDLDLDAAGNDSD